MPLDQAAVDKLYLDVCGWSQGEPGLVQLMLDLSIESFINQARVCELVLESTAMRRGVSSRHDQVHSFHLQTIYDHPDAQLLLPAGALLSRGLSVRPSLPQQIDDVGRNGLNRPSRVRRQRE